MCVHSFKVEKYKLGMEDGFDQLKNKQQLKNLPKCCIPIMMIPYIYNQDGEKEYLTINDNIIFNDGFKQITK